jgi:predicted phosphodiesterase
MEYKYTNFIPQNIAFNGTTRIGVYKGNQKVCNIPLGRLTPTEGEKLYSFGVLSDVHLHQPEFTTAFADFQRALEFLTETENVDFTCICGDMTYRGYDDQMADYQRYVTTYSPNTPVYAVAGNHETYRGTDLSSVIANYTGYPLYYAVTKNTTDDDRRIYANNNLGENDVFIFVGDVYDAGAGGQPFLKDELQWLYTILEEYRNKRCFLFQHVRPDDSCGNAFGVYTIDIWGGNTSVSFENLLKHYRNVIFFHGHSHLKFELQTKGNLANYDNKYGMHSIHIPSLAAPRTGNTDGTGLTNLDAESEGYVVDVYDNGIHLRGRDFVDGEFLPIASYWLDTTLKTIPANTFMDSTGIITT